MRVSRRARIFLLAAGALGVGLFIAYRIALSWLVTAPNAGDPAPAPRSGEEVVSATTAPPETIAYEIVSSLSAGTSGQPAYTVVVLHGLRDSRESMREWAQHLADGGARAILVDARGHGRSTGDRFSYGVRESLDLMNVTDALAARGALVGKLGVLGFSCGGATAIQWAARDARVAAVVAVAPFATMDFVRSYSPVPLPDVLVNAMIASVGRRSGFDPAEAGGLAWIDKVRLPIQLIHGALDKRVIPDNSRRLFAHALTGSDLFIVPDATHPSMLRDASQVGRERARSWFEARLR